MAHYTSRVEVSHVHSDSVPRPAHPARTAAGLPGTALLPSSLLYEWLATSGKRFYRRLFTPLVTLWGVIFQRLNADHSCDAALAHIASGAVDDYVRMERPGFRPLDLYLFTTLLDAQRYPLVEPVKLYGLRWHAEIVYTQMTKGT